MWWDLLLLNLEPCSHLKYEQQHSQTINFSHFFKTEISALQTSKMFDWFFFHSGFMLTMNLMRKLAPVHSSGLSKQLFFLKSSEVRGRIPSLLRFYLQKAIFKEKKIHIWIFRFCFSKCPSSRPRPALRVLNTFLDKKGIMQRYYFLTFQIWAL